MRRKIFLLFGTIVLIFCLLLAIASCVSSDNDTSVDIKDEDSSIDIKDEDASLETENNTTSTQQPDHDHIYELMVLLAPTCGVEGKQAYVCVICGKKQHETGIEALQHNYQFSSELSVPATCTSGGKRTEYCNKCGGIKVDEAVWKARGHSWIDKTTCDSSTNELIITPHCTMCQLVSAYEFRYKINDVVKLVPAGNYYLFGDLDYILGVGDHQQNVAKAPYYGVYCCDGYLLILRNTKSFGYYGEYASSQSPLEFYTSRGCNVVYEADITITEDGRIVVLPS